MPPTRTRYAPFLAALLLAWFLGQALSVSDRMGITADEPIHLASGYTYWTANDYRLQPENGNFPQRWAALPLLAMPVRGLPADHDSWRRADNWGAAHAFLFQLGNQPGLMVFAGRCMIGLLGVATGWLVFLIARGLFGGAAGVLATALFACTPGILAHGALVTSDMAASLGFLLALATGWRLLHRASLARAVGFGLALGLLATAKFSAALFAVIWAPVLLIRLLHPAPLPCGRSRGRHLLERVVKLAVAHVVALLVAWACIWAAYGFRFQATPGPEPAPVAVSWDILLGRTPFLMQTPAPHGVAPTHGVPVEPGFVRSVVGWARDHRVLPEAYLFGFSHVYTFSKWRPAFFLGEYGTTGWRTFFPILHLLKTPPALLVLSLLAIGALAGLVRRAHRERHAHGRLYRLTPYLVFVAVYVAFAIVGSLNIGHRHLLPVEVVGCILTGLLAVGWSRQPAWRRGAVLGLLAAGFVAAWSARPDYLAYFSPLAGGPNQGHRYVVDSSVDWGQGLPALREWLARHPSPGPLYLAYFGSDSPLYEGLRARRIGDIYFDRDRRPVQTSLSPGTYAVSATLLHGVYTMLPDPWSPEYERCYQRMLAELAGGRTDRDFWYEWDQVRFARLRRYLLRRAPDAQPDPSILVYRLSAEDLRRALLAPD